MKEIWKDVKDYETSYKVSNLGRVISKERLSWNGVSFFTKKEIVMKITDNGNGYKLVSLSNAKGRTNHYIHRLVATAFIPNESIMPQVNHKDGNKSNNCVSNLEWVSVSENHLHAVGIGLRGTISESHRIALANGRLRALGKPILNIKTGKIYSCITSAAKDIGMHRVTMQRKVRKGIMDGFKLLHPLEAMQKGHSISKHSTLLASHDNEVGATVIEKA